MPTRQLSAQTLITEATYSGRLSPGPDLTNGVSGSADWYNPSVSLGVSRKFGDKISIGAVATGGTWGEVYLGIGPRISVSATDEVDLNITPTYLALRGGEPGKDKGMLDVSVMHKQRVGISVQVVPFNEYHFGPTPGVPPTEVKQTIYYAGIRVGSKPGRVGIVLDAITIAGAFVIYLLHCGAGGCE